MGKGAGYCWGGVKLDNELAYLIYNKICVDGTSEIRMCRLLLYENNAIVAWFREALAVSNKKTPIVILDLIFRALRLGGRLAADLGVHV